MLEDLWMIPLGFGAGIVGSMIGLGGGIIIVPALTFMGFPPTLAASNSLFGAFGNAGASVIAYARQRRIEYSLGIRLGLLAIPGTILGAVASVDATPELFKILFGALLVASGAYMLVKNRIKESGNVRTGTIMVLAAAASFFAGMISSFFGVGGGIIFVPLMVIIMGMGMRRAAPTSQLVLLFTSLSGLIAHSVLGHPDFYQALLLASGSFVGGLLGARISRDLRERFLRSMISAVIIIVAVRLFWEALESMGRGIQ